MSTDLAARPAPSPTPPPGPAEARAGHRAAPLHAERASVRLALRQIWLGGLVIVASVGFLLWAGTDAFHKSAQTGGIMMSLADNPAVRAIYGLPTAIDTVGGFAVWRVELFVTLLATVWITLATTRILRGNEETGRLDLVLANPLSLILSTATSLLAVLVVPVLAMVLTGAVLQGAGGQAAGSWLFAAGLGLLLATFMGLAALASQLVPERRRATGLAVGVLFATFVLRMWADGSTDAGFVRWLTPFGWLEQLHAFGANDLLPLIPLIVTPLVLVASALVLAARRDTGAGMVRADDTKKANTRLLGKPLAFSSRRRLAELAGWGVAVVVLGLLSGGLAESLVGFGQTQPEAMKTLEQFGMASAVTPGGFIAVMNVFYAVVLAGFAIACIHGDYDDEITNRLDLPYSNRVSRTAWAGSTAATTAGLVVLTLALGLATWAGSAASGAGLSAGDVRSSAANVLPVPVLFLGMAVLLHGVRPSWTVSVVGILAIGLYLVSLIGPALKWPTWVIDLSPYHHLALVPAETAAWAALGIMIGMAAVGVALGLLSYAHRDLQ